MFYRHRKCAFCRPAVEIDKDDSLDPAGVQQVSDQSGAQRLTAVSTPILASIAEVWDHSRSMNGPCAATRVSDKHEFQQVLVDGWGSGLNDIEIIAADAFPQLNVQLAIGESLESSRRKL
jgi:hypothetical protein